MKKKTGTAKTKLTKKEAKAKVLRTKLGKNTKKGMITSIIIFIISFAINMILMDKIMNDDYTATEAIIYQVSSIVFMISGFICCYFDGKMDGLIASYKN